MKKVFSTYTLLLSVVIILCSGCGPGETDEANSKNQPSETGSLNKVGEQTTGIGEGDYLCFMDDSCTRANSCLYPDCCEAAAQCHEVGRNSFNRMAGSDEPGKVFTIAQIEAIMSRQDCSSWIHVNRTPANNSDIVLTAEQAGKCPDKNAVHFTIQFFKGVIQRRPEKLVFYKATAYARPTIVFSAVRELRQIVGQPAIIYYDFSEANPHMLPKDRFRGSQADGGTQGQVVNPH